MDSVPVPSSSSDFNPKQGSDHAKREESGKDMIKRFQELKHESSRLQRESAPPIILGNQLDIELRLKDLAATSAPWQNTIPILRPASTRGSTPEASDGGMTSSTLQQNEPTGFASGAVKMTHRKSVSVRGVLPSHIPAGTSRVTSSVLPTCKPPPNFVSWAFLKHNELARDHGKRMFYTDPSTGETIPDSDDESQQNLPWEAQKGPAIDYALMGVVQEQGPSSEVLAMLADQIGTKPQAVAARLNALTATQPEEDKRKDSEVDDVLDSFFGVFCRRCRIFNCRLHGGNQVRPHVKPQPPSLQLDSTEPCGLTCWLLDPTSRQLISMAEQLQRVDDAAAAVATASGADSDMDEDGAEDTEDAPSTAMINQSMASASIQPSSAQVNDAAASEGAAKDGAGDSNASPTWTVWEESMLARSQLLCGMDCCAIARLMEGRSCTEVATRLAALKSGGQASEEFSARRIRGRKGLTKHWSHKARKLTVAVCKKSNIFKKRMNHQENELWSEYVPCSCVGSCNGDSCSCHRERNFCEKYCGCASKCSNRFRGCTCRGQCRNRMCPCLAAGRECDPDLCKGCSATCEGSAPPGTECLNMRLRLRQHMRVMMGKSTVQGWGAFLQGSCAEDDYLGEYTGDLITQDEADRRGRIYDRMNNSYLFNLNEQWVLDARHRGNKFRFANHDSKPNSKVRLLMVDGDWRVAVYAQRNIRPNEELFYDYRYDQDVRPDWAQKG